MSESIPGNQKPKDNLKSTEHIMRGVYEHVDGGSYRTEGMVFNDTDLELHGRHRPMVLYVQLTRGERFLPGTLWVRVPEDFSKNFMRLGTVPTEVEEVPPHESEEVESIEVGGEYRSPSGILHHVEAILNDATGYEQRSHGEGHVQFRKMVLYSQAEDSVNPSFTEGVRFVREVEDFKKNFKLAE